MIQVIDVTKRAVAEEIHRLQLASYKVEAEIIGSDQIPPLRETIEDIQTSKETYIGCFLENQIAGALSYEIMGNTLIICKLMVHPIHFRKGIASQLLSYLIQKEEYIPVIKVSTGAKNVPAKKVYTNFGFQEKETIEIEKGLFITFFTKKNGGER